MQEKGEFFLHAPSTTIHQPKIRVRAILGHCLYRRVVIWTVIVSLLLGLAYLNTPLRARDGKVLGDDYRIGGLGGQPNTQEIQIPNEVMPDVDGSMPPWLKFKQ